MGQIEEIIKRRQAEKPATPPMPVNPEYQEDKFFSILISDGAQENFLELRTRDGLRTCFPYADIIWVVYDPDNGLNIEFGGYLVTIEGRGLVPKLFDGIKHKRVAWVKEGDHELQDNKSNETYISNITITPPKGFGEEDEQPSE